MERTMTVEERIRRAEEIYERRKRNQGLTVVNEEKNEEKKPDKNDNKKPSKPSKPNKDENKDENKDDEKPVTKPEEEKPNIDDSDKDNTSAGGDDKEPSEEGNGNTITENVIMENTLKDSTI